jgi:hypothetical protein
LENEAEVALSIWQLLESPHSFEVSSASQIVMELMRVDS